MEDLLRLWPTRFARQHGPLRPVSHRHVVLTIPRLLRPLLRRRRELVTELGRAAAEAVAELVRRALRDDVHPGLVVSIATAGDLVQWHPHVHLLTSDGGRTTDGSWTPLAEWDGLLLMKPFRERLLARLLEAHAISPELVQKLAPTDTQRLEDTAAYRNQYYSEWMRPLASIRTSEGCPYRCRFCALWKIAGGRYLRRRPESAVEELLQVHEDFVFFADDESLIDVPRMKTLARLVAEAGLRKRYFLYGRADTIARNPDLVGLWREIGLERVFVGLEFFRDEDLRDVGKGSTTDDNQRAEEVLHDHGLEVYASFILRPEFTPDDFATVKDYCHELDVDFASFGVLTPLPGTDLMEQVQADLITQDYDSFDFIHTVLPTTLPLEEFYAEYAGLYAQALSPRRQRALLSRLRLRDLPAAVVRGLRFQKRLEKAYRDYEETRLRRPRRSLAPVEGQKPRIFPMRPRSLSVSATR